MNLNKPCRSRSLATHTPSGSTGLRAPSLWRRVFGSSWDRSFVYAAKQAWFEHPRGAITWTHEEMQQLLNTYHHLKCHMCVRRFGLKLPGSEHYIRKSTRLLVSHQSMTGLGLTCPGKKDPHHTGHDVVAGSHAGVGSLSEALSLCLPNLQLD